MRKNLKMTQKEFADFLGVKAITVNRWENERFKPSALAALKLREVEKMIEEKT